MELDLTKIKSLVEKNMVDAGFGSFPIGPSPAPDFRQEPYNLDIHKFWTDALSDSIKITLREFSSSIAQTIYDALTDASSTGASISSPGVYGGGNKTPSTGDGLLKAVDGKKYTIQVGAYEIRVDDALDQIEITNGTTESVLIDTATHLITFNTSAETMVIGDNSRTQIKTKVINTGDWTYDSPGSGKYYYVWTHGKTLSPIYAYNIQAFDSAYTSVGLDHIDTLSSTQVKIWSTTNALRNITFIG